MATNDQEAVVDPVDPSEQDMIPSVKKVFGTAELLEAILSEVDMRTLLSQRTCKDFRDTIDGSVKLQRALYFRDDAEMGSESEFNPLLALEPGATDYKCDFGNVLMGVSVARAAFTNKKIIPWTRPHRNLRRVEGDQLASWTRMHPYNHPGAIPVTAALYNYEYPFFAGRRVQFERDHLTFGEILQTAEEYLVLMYGGTRVQ